MKIVVNEKDTKTLRDFDDEEYAFIYNGDTYIYPVHNTTVPDNQILVVKLSEYNEPEVLFLPSHTLVIPVTLEIEVNYVKN